MDNNQLAKLLKSLPEDFNEEIERLKLLQSMPQDSLLRIANAGPMNPGKSTLFNAFLKKPEVFKTADARQTTVCQTENWGKTFCLLDTPGCNSAIFEDNKESVSAFRKADFITFVHNINTGGLLKAEIDILKELSSIFGEDEFLKRVCIVCNRIDDAPDEKTIQKNRDEIVGQLQEYLSAELKIFCVSPLYYLEGISLAKKDRKEEANIFFENSNMKELLDYIKTVWEKQGKRVLIDYNPILIKLNRIKEHQNKELQKNKTSLSTAQKNTKTIWKQTLDNIRPAWDECR